MTRVRSYFSSPKAKTAWSQTCPRLCLTFVLPLPLSGLAVSFSVGAGWHRSWFPSLTGDKTTTTVTQIKPPTKVGACGPNRRHEKTIVTNGMYIIKPIPLLDWLLVIDLSAETHEAICRFWGGNFTRNLQLYRMLSYMGNIWCFTKIKKILAGLFVNLIHGIS